MLLTVRTMLLKAGVREEHLKKSDETLRVRTVDGTWSQVSCFPSNPTTIRGVNSTLVVVDEAVFASEALYLEVILPLLEVRSSRAGSFALRAKG